MARLIRWLGSLTIAVPLLVAIAAVLGWGTFYEVRFGTAAVQRVVYQSWWFHALLAFLALNLAAAAIHRYPWQRRHTPFVMAHIGIILILLGGIIGGTWGIEGQLVIPEGRAERMLQLPDQMLVVRERNPGTDHAIRTSFESAAWVQEPNTVFDVPLTGRSVRLTVDRYYPDAVMEEQVVGDGARDNPAIRVEVGHGGSPGVWLFARDPDRSGATWAEAHVLFVEPATTSQWRELMGRGAPAPSTRGVLVAEFAHLNVVREIPVPAAFGKPVAIAGTPYRVTFKDYFSDFAIQEGGPVNRSEQPNNPAVAFVLAGPEGSDAHLLFALHPDFPALHGHTQQIAVRLRYLHPALWSMPPQAIGIVRSPSGTLAAVLTSPAGERARIEPLDIGRAYRHPWLGEEFTVTAYHPRARVLTEYRNRGTTVRSQALHVIGREGGETAEVWLTAGETVELPLGKDPLLIGYGAAQRELPFTVKLLDFRKIDYPGTDMASDFESDVEVTDAGRGLILMRKISMNKPLRYRGYSLYQSSYIPGPIETTVLAVRNDPGTPFVYAGFLTVLAGVVGMFLLRGRESS